MGLRCYFLYGGMGLESEEAASRLCDAVVISCLD